MHLADAAALSQPEEAAGTLRTAIEDVQSRFEPIELEFAGIPSVTVSVGTDASLAAIYGTIRAIQQTSRGVRLEVLIMDDGSNPQICLLPLIVTNLRYVRGVGAASPVALLNQAARAARGKVFVRLAAGLGPQGTWLRDILARYSTDPKMAVVAAKVVRSDGPLEHAGVMSINHELQPAGRALDPTSPNFNSPMLVDSVLVEAFCVRLDLWRLLDGLDPTFSDPNEAMVTFCRMVQERGDRIIFEPRFKVVQATFK